MDGPVDYLPVRTPIFFCPLLMAAHFCDRELFMAEKEEFKLFWGWPTCIEPLGCIFCGCIFEPALLPLFGWNLAILLWKSKFLFIELFNSLLATEFLFEFTAFNFCFSAVILSIPFMALGSLLFMLSELVDYHDYPFLNFSSWIMIWLANDSDSFMRFFL